MTGVFRSCLPRFNSNTNQSISIVSIDNEEFDENRMDIPLTQIHSTSSHKNRGPSYSRINEKSTSLLTRLVGTVFGTEGYNNSNHKSKKTRSKRSTRPLKKSLVPSKSTIKKQFEDNERTLRSLVTLLTQMESNSKITTDENLNLPIEKEQARNNNRMDDTSSSQSHDSYHHKSKGKSSSRRYTNNRSTKKYSNNKRKLSEENSLSSSSITTHYSLQSPPIIRRKMIDNQQQTQFNPINDEITSEPSWLDVMREDQTTIDAWARIRRRLKPNQQKDILRALMIICANLFEVPIENKQF